MDTTGKRCISIGWRSGEYLFFDTEQTLMILFTNCLLALLHKVQYSYVLCSYQEQCSLKTQPVYA